MTDAIKFVVDHWEEGLAAIGGAVIALEVLVRALQALAGVLAKFALITATKADDDAVSWLSGVLASVANALKTVEQVLPRARLGKTPAPTPSDVIVKATIAAAEIENEKGGA